MRVSDKVKLYFSILFYYGHFDPSRRYTIRWVITELTKL
jgi:hypothetical protein